MWINENKYQNINYEIQELKGKVEAQDKIIWDLLQHLDLGFIDKVKYEKILAERHEKEKAWPYKRDDCWKGYVINHEED